MNLFDLGMRIAGDMQQLSVDGLGANYSENPHWRFVMDNSVPHALPAFMELINLLTDSVRMNAQEFVGEGFIVLCEVVAALTFRAPVTDSSKSKAALWRCSSSCCSSWANSCSDAHWRVWLSLSARCWRSR